MEAGNIWRCPECGSTMLRRDYENGEIVCVDCGFVVATRMVFRGPEWRAFDREQLERRERAGAPLTYMIHDKGLSTVIDSKDRDAYGNRLTPAQKAQMNRLRRLQRRIRVSDKTERNLVSALSIINNIVSKLDLPKSISESVSIICRRVLKKKVMRGRSIRDLIAAAVYMACRESGCVITPKDIASASAVSKADIIRSYSFLVKQMDFNKSSSKPSDYLLRFSKKLMAQGRFEEVAKKILRVAEELETFSRKEPRGLATAACYMALILTGERITQREVAEIAEVTDVTVRNRCNEFMINLLFIVSL